jgi:hypothetical protein
MLTKEELIDTDKLIKAKEKKMYFSTSNSPIKLTKNINILIHRT